MIEFSNYCVKNCLYCGLRRCNNELERYRLKEDEIIMLVKHHWEKGMNSFVLQSGEDPMWQAGNIAKLISRIKSEINPNIAITMSCGVFNKKDLQTLIQSGMDRYLIRFETSDKKIFSILKPDDDFNKRMFFIENLLDHGVQTGSGFMIGLPEESNHTIQRNLSLCEQLRLDMVSAGVFIAHKETPLAQHPSVNVEKMIYVYEQLRIMNPDAHIPLSTSSLAIFNNFAEKLLSSGPNVLMVNLTPFEKKYFYQLYDKSINQESEIGSLSYCKKLVSKLGKQMDLSRNDSIIKRNNV